MKNYLSDELVEILCNATASGKKICPAEKIFNLKKAENQDGGIASLIDGIMNKLRSCYGLCIEPKFVFAKSPLFMQACKLDEETFIIVIDIERIYSLFNICIQISKYSPLSEYLGMDAIATNTSHRGKTVLEILGFLSQGQKKSENSGFHNKHFNIIYSAIFFFICHEYCHIAHGHLDFLFSNQKESYPSWPDQKLTQRALEMDADSSATSHLIVNIAIHANFQVITNPNARTEIFRESLLGPYCCFLFSDLFSKNHFPEYHPINYARYLTFKNVAYRTLEINNYEYIIPLIDELRTKIVGVFESISNGAKNLGHPLASNALVFDVTNETIKSQYFYSVEDHTIQMHLEPLAARWASIRPILCKFLRGGQLAPAARIPA